MRSAPSQLRQSVLAPLLVGGAALLITSANLLRQLSISERESLRRARRLARAIPGNNKHAVAAALGAPHGSAGAALPESMFLASSWYYRLDSKNQIAIAIEFDADDTARQARVLRFKRHVLRAPVTSRTAKV